MKNRQTSYQYEPLVTPTKWQGEERRFSIRLTQLLDDLFGKYGSLSAQMKAPQNTSVDLLSVYPVGSIYLTVNDVSPAVLFGGTWERLKDKFLLAAGDTYEVGSEGGEAQHLLTEEELPALSGTFRSFDWFNLGNKDAANYITGVFSYDESESDGTSTNMGSGKNDTLRTIHLNIGDDQPHNNMPPYLSVFMWKRTA
jgi:hypothetical protein